jgi:hypothetical protein
MNASAAENALNNLSLSAMKKKSTARNAVKAKFVNSSVVPVFLAAHCQENAVPVRHRVFPEPADSVAAVG